MIDDRVVFSEISTHFLLIYLGSGRSYANRRFEVVLISQALSKKPSFRPPSTYTHRNSQRNYIRFLALPMVRCCSG